MKTFYKVVKLYSNNAFRSSMYGNLIYRYGHWTYPKIQYSKLFVFDNIKSALKFAILSEELIYECEVKNPHQIKMVCVEAESDVSTKYFWKLKHQKKSVADIGVSIGYKGVYVCDAVKLLKRVDV